MLYSLISRLRTLAPSSVRLDNTRERNFPGAKVPHLELSLPGANGLGSEKSSSRCSSVSYEYGWPIDALLTLYSREAIICATSNKCIGDDTKAVAHQSPNCIKNKKISEKRFSICRMEFLHAAMWHDRDIDFARWLHPAMWHVTLESWHGIRQVAALCSVAGGSGMTCHWIRLNVRHIGILHLVSISTTSLQSTCHSAPVSEILSKSDHPRQKNDVMSIFERADLSHLVFYGSFNGFFKSPGTNSYRLSMETIALNCLVFEKIAFLHFGVKIQDGGSPPSWILGVL